MKEKYVIVMRTSCDKKFIERVAREDPFDYWNRCISPGTDKDTFDVENPKTDVLINEAGDFPYTHEIAYFTDSPDVIEAVIMYFGAGNIKHFQKKE